MTAESGKEQAHLQELPPEDEIRVFELLSVLVRRWRIMVAVPLVFGVAAAIWSLTVKPVFTATTSFFPEQETQASLPSGLSGLTSQFGVSLGGAGGQSPRLYAEILESHAIRVRVLTSRYAVAGGQPGDSATLISILELDDENPAVELDRGEKALSSRVAVGVNARTGVVRLSVEAGDPVLAADVANRYFECLNEFNAEMRQSSAANRRAFGEERMIEAERALREAEGELRAFYESNRSYQQAPQLVFEEGRLRRQVELRQDLYITLAREFERARIDQVNDVTAITVIDVATAPLIRTRPRRRRTVTIALVLGGAASIVLVLGAHFLEGAARARDKGLRELVSSLVDIRSDLNGLFRGFGRRKAT